MQSRTRKILRYENDSEAIIKQLQNDFQVFEYLKENKLESNNIEEYARLYNCLIAEQQERRAAHERLMAEFQKLKEKGDDSEEMIIQQRERKLEGIQERTCKEMQVSNQLEKEIVQTKKSLNLLKGDIGHLVGRNESAKLLSSKISKVKIVAQDQLKRVTLAFIKDKQEIKLRNQMQKKFGKKLKNVSSYQSNSLTRLKRNYAEIQLKKQDIWEKLMASQKISEKQEQVQMLKCLKQQKDGQNSQQIQLLLRLAKVTSEFSLSTLSSLSIDPNALIERVTAYYQQLQQQQIHSDFTHQINSAVSIILEEYHRAEESIKAQSQFYQELLIIRKEGEKKLSELEGEEGELARKFNLELEDTYKIDHKSEEQYQVKLKQFGEILNTLFVLLSYLQKNIPFFSSYPLQHKFFCYQNEPQRHDRKSLMESKFRQSQSSQQSQRQSRSQSQKTVHYNYINCLHRVNQLLSGSLSSQQLNFNQQIHEQEINSFYAALLQDVKQWLGNVRKKFSQEYLQKIMQSSSQDNRISITRHSIFQNSRRTTHFKKETSSFHQDQQDIQEGEKQELNCFTGHCSENQHQLYQKSPSAGSISHSVKEAVKAKRIKLLEGIDIDYYKMIKSTIKMEKENTRKNYQFLRTFKRAKYASRDNILQQKRFQASFSVLFTKQSVPALSKISSKFDTSSKMVTRCGESITKHRSFFKNSSNPFNSTTSGTCTPHHQRSPVSRTIQSRTIQEAVVRRSRMTDKLKLALQFT